MGSTAVSAMVALAMLIPAASAQPGGQDEAVARFEAAATTEGATRARLGVLGDAFTCADARFVSFRRSDAEPQIVDQWYVASQVWADAALLRVAAPEMPMGDSSKLTGWDSLDTRCYVDKGFVFLDRLWDYTRSGYFPMSDPVGANVATQLRFGDDNTVAGLALLETASSTTDPLLLQRYIHAAEREADFLTDPVTGLWDTRFGGGFWWETARGDTDEGKPAQTNALAALFFVRLYNATGISTYRDWALRTLLWLDTILYDPGRHLYRWSVGYQDLTNRTGAIIHQRYFNYDQGIAVEAQIEAAQLDGDQNRLSRSRDVGRAIQTAFWSNDRGGYNLESGIDQVYASYAAWTSLGHLAMYRLDGSSEWLALARQNLNSLQTDLAEPDGGYAFRSYRCLDRVAKGCETGQVQHVVDHTRDTSAQAWMQHLQASVAGAELPEVSPR